MSNLLQRWWLVAVVLVVANLLATKLCYDHLNPDITTGLTLDASLDEWIAAKLPGDCAHYLQVAKSVARGKGVQQPVPNTNPVQYEPFCYWGPGAPWVMGKWLRRTGGDTVWSIFWFSTVVHFLFSVIAVMTAAICTRRTSSLVLTAIVASVCPVLRATTHCSFYWYAMGSSEIVALVPMGLAILALTKAFQLKSSPQASRWWIVAWFVSAGIWLGLASLIRDSFSTFGLFVALFLMAQHAIRRPPLAASQPTVGRFFRLRWILFGSACAGCLLCAVHLVRLPVQSWNQQRIGQFVVATSSQNLLLRYELWEPHDKNAFYQSFGVGFGEYLAPDAAQRVEAEYQADNPWAGAISLWELTKAVCSHPLDAFAFKVARWPVMWFATERWPHSEMSSTGWWCLAFYLMLSGYLARQWWVGRTVPEAVYLFPLFLFCASWLIHSEFRYSYPSWHGLVLLPGLLWHSLRDTQTAAVLPASATTSSRYTDSASRLDSELADAA